jgi:hypothetical protein
MAEIVKISSVKKTDYLYLSVSMGDLRSFISLI